MYNITGLTPSTRYTIAVAAVNDGGTGPYSDPPLTVQTLSNTGTGDRIEMCILKLLKCCHYKYFYIIDITGHGDIGVDVVPVIATLFIIVMVTVIIIAVAVAVIRQ